MAGLGRRGLTNPTPRQTVSATNSGSLGERSATMAITGLRLAILHRHLVPMVDAALTPGLCRRSKKVAPYNQLRATPRLAARRPDRRLSTASVGPQVVGSHQYPSPVVRHLRLTQVARSLGPGGTLLPSRSAGFRR